MTKEKGALLICLLVCFLGLSPGGIGMREMVSAAAQGNNAGGGGTTTTWCIVKPSTSQEELDNIIRFCCTQPGVDCSLIQPGGACYLPSNKISDASVVMNIYYNIHGKTPDACDFTGTGLTVTTDPSVGNCIYRA